MAASEAPSPHLPTVPRQFHSVTVRCPATTANMGPGFDCLGMLQAVLARLAARADRQPRLYAGSGH